MTSVQVLLLYNNRAWERLSEFPSLTLSQLVGNLCLVLGAHANLTLVSQQSLLHGVKHQRVEETILGEKKAEGVGLLKVKI